MQFDLIIRGGTIHDGTGAQPYVADVAIMDGKIYAIGSVDGTGREEIDASGLIVTPGFVDVHTHYDGQLIWSPQLSPSSSHGVTTVVTGNCGVGFAPCRPEDRDTLMDLLEGVEDLPGIVLSEGLTWEWTSFPDYIRAVDARAHDIDFAVQVPHAALRMFVMGDRSAEQATDAELNEMRRLTREAIEAGAVGFGTSRSVFHQSIDGSVIPSIHAPKSELGAIAAGIREAGKGVMQILLPLKDHHDIAEFEEFSAISEKTGVPFSYSCMQTKFEPESWRTLLRMTEEANARGVKISSQVLCRPSGILLGLDITYNPFIRHPSYRKIADLPLEERVALMRTPEIRETILADAPDDQTMIYYEFSRDFEHMYALGNPPIYEPTPGSSVAETARRRGVSPFEVAYDMLLEDEGRAILQVTATNYENESFDDLLEMMEHPSAVLALGDGGAHYAVICDAAYPTFMLSYWGRDRKEGTLPLPWIVHMLTQKPARMMRFEDRGVIAPGYKADLNVIDFEAMRLHAPHTANDLPGGTRRINQTADGYVATIVSGEVIMAQGQPTGALPGRRVSV